MHESQHRLERNPFWESLRYTSVTSLNFVVGLTQSLPFSFSNPEDTSLKAEELTDESSLKRVSFPAANALSLVHDLRVHPPKPRLTIDTHNLQWLVETNFLV